MWVCIKVPKNFLENSSPLAGLEPTTSPLHAEYTYKCMHRYIHLGFCNIIAYVSSDIHMNMDRHARQTPKSKYLIKRYILKNNRQNERVLLIFHLASLFFRIQHTSKPLYAKFVAFRRKWRSISHIHYTIYMYWDNDDPRDKIHCSVNYHANHLYQGNAFDFICQVWSVHAVLNHRGWVTNICHETWQLLIQIMASLWCQAITVSVKFESKFDNLYSW